MSEFKDIVEWEPKPKRPNFLTVLCILTLVNTGLSVITSVVSLLHGPISEDEMMAQRVQFLKLADEMHSMDMSGFAEMMDQIQRMSEAANAHFYPNTLLSLCILGLGVAGSIFMLKGRKLGFHLYIAYSLLAVLQLYFFASPADIPTVAVVFGLLFSGLFIFLYSKNLHWINAMENGHTVGDN
jgi:hypothetical protein